MFSVFIKIRYNENSFLMLGNQFGFCLNSINDIDDLLSIIQSRLDDSFEEYNLTNASISYLQISFRQLNKKLSSDLLLDKLPYLTKSDILETKRDLNIPVSTNLGNSLDVVVKDGFIIDIPITINNKKINFIDCIKEKSKVLKIHHKDNITSFDSSFKFYLLKDSSDYVLAIKSITNISIQKIRFSLNGVVVNHIIDNISDDIIHRNVNNKVITIKDDKVILTNQNINFKPIYKPKSVKSSFISNPNIGVIDAETYKGNDNITKIYAIGFRTNLDDKPVTYYIDKKSMVL
jgi:hypothetical protein